MPFSEKVEKALADLFDMVDTNKSGVIEKAEQQKVMKKIHSMMLPQARWSWSDMDKNLDGKISKSEWHEAMQAIAAKIGVKDLVACIIRGWPDHPLALAEEHDAWGCYWEDEQERLWLERINNCADSARSFYYM